MRRRGLIWAGAIALTAMGCGGDHASSPVSAANASHPAPAAPASADARAFTATDGILSVLTVEHEVDVRAQHDGIVQQLSVEEGQHVKPGEILGRLDDRALQLELQKAQSDLIVAQDNLKYKEAEHEAKEANLKRQELLRQAGLSSEADLEEAQFESKATAYDAESYRALVKSSEAQIQSLQIQVEQSQFRAPFAGVVVRRYVRQGQSVQKDDLGFRVSQVNPLQVHFQVPENSGGRPDVGTSVQLAPVADPNHSYAARIMKVSPMVDPASDSYDVMAQLNGPGLAALSPGMAVRVNWPPSAGATSNKP
jgi:membrane fusion protein, multidrug efflux system